MAAESSDCIRVPSSLAPTGDELNLDVVDMAIVYGHIERYFRRSGGSPNKTDLFELTGFGDQRLSKALDRLTRMGWVQAKKVPYRYGSGPRDFVRMWSFELVENSHIVKELAKGYVQVSLAMARYRGGRAVPAYVLWAEQQRVDGGTSTTTADDAKRLRCTPSTVRRLKRRANMRAVITPTPGKFLGMLQLPWWSHTRREVLEVRGHKMFVPGPSRERLLARHDALRQALASEGIDVAAAELHALEQIKAALAEREVAHFGTLTRFLELRYARLLVANKHYVGKLENRLASRLRGLGVRRGAIAARKTSTSTSSSCSGCRQCDDGWIELPDATWARCSGPPGAT